MKFSFCLNKRFRHDFFYTTFRITAFTISCVITTIECLSNELIFIFYQLNLFIFDYNNYRQFWLGKTVENPDGFEFDIYNLEIETDLKSLYIPHSHAIVSFNGEPDSKLMLTAKNKDGHLIVEEWEVKQYH